MPLVRIDLVEGRSADELKSILNATHSALVAAFRIPESDRYQILQEHLAGYFLLKDTGLGMQRTAQRILVQVTTRPRSQHSKRAFYQLLCDSLRKECDIDPMDVVVSMVTNSDEDWSFGLGRAQFLTGELEAEALPDSRHSGKPAAERHRSQTSL
jgi:hypothetical protein